MWQKFDQLPVLIAEDSNDDLLLLQQTLRNEQVANPQLVAKTGTEALSYLERALDFQDKQPFPVLLFLDLLMPEMGGLEVLKWLADHPHPPVTVVLHTGVDDETLLQKARDLGASFYLPKGVRSDAIREVVCRAQEEWEQRQSIQA